MAETRPKPAPPTPTVPSAAVSDDDRTRLSDVPPAAVDHTEVRAAHAEEPKPAAHAISPRTVEEELLRELRQMNRQLNHLTQGYRRYTLSFFSGVVRGLGAAIGATVVFAVFLAAVSRLDTTPIIGNYVKRVVGVVKNSTASASGNLVEFDPSAKNPFLPESDAVVQVDSDPTGAEIWLDGTDTGRKTPVSDLALSPGHHELRLASGETSLLLPLEAKPGETMKLGVEKLAP